MKYINKQTILSPIALSIALTSSGLMMQSAHAEISANVALSNDYYFRGVSQTANDPAISGGFDWAHDSGIYAGTWASNVDFGNDTSIEIDLYGGYAGEISNFGYDVGLIYYYYDDVSGTGSTPYEVYLKGSYSLFSAGYAYSPKFFSDEASHYVDLGIEYTFAYDITAAASVGRSMGDAYSDDYTDYKIGVSKEVFGVGLDLSYVGNDLDNPTNDKALDDKFLFTVSKSF